MPAVLPEYAALSSAISLYRQPMLARKLIKFELPVGMALVLKIAAEGAEAASTFAGQFGVSADELYQACLLYLQTVVFHQQASDTRLLALTEPLDHSELKAHKRMIYKWLHPDRNHNSWENKLFLRVKAAIVRLEKRAEPLGAVMIGTVVTPLPIRRKINHASSLYSPRQPVPNFWWRLPLTKIIAILLVLLFLGVVGWALFTVEFGVHGFDFGNEAAN